MNLKQHMGLENISRHKQNKVRIPSIKIEMLMGHSLGVTDSYARFTEEQMLEDYMFGIDFLTVNQTVVLINKSLKKQEETIQNSLKEMEERHRKELNGLHEKYESDMKSFEEKMENKLQQILLKINVEKILRE